MTCCLGLKLRLLFEINIVIQRVHEIVMKVITVIVDGYIVEMCRVFDTVYTLSELEKVEIVEL